MSDESNSLDPLVEEQVADLCRAGRKLDAIKALREATGMGLKESKEAVEALARRHGIEMQSTGCGTAVLLVAIVSALAGALTALVAG